MQKTPGGIAARAGRWSARHKKTAIIGWLVFVVVALMAGSMTGTKEPTDADRYDGESRAAQQMRSPTRSAGRWSRDASAFGTTSSMPSVRASRRRASRAAPGSSK